MIGDPDVLHGGQIHHVELVGRRPHAAGFHVIFQRFRHAGDQELVSGAARLGAHLGLLPLRGAGVLGEETHLGRGEAHQPRGDHLVGALAHGAVAGLDLDVVERLHLALGQAAPQQRSAIAQETRAGRAQPDQHQRGDHRGGGEAENPGGPGDLLRLGLLGHRQRIVRQQLQEGIARVLLHALAEGEQALFELRILVLGRARRAPAVEADHRHDQRRRQGEGQPQKQQHPRAHHARTGKGEVVGHQHGQHREGQSRGRGHRRAARQRQPPQPPLDGAQIFGQAIQRFHAASLSTERC